jgi:hypothetical protein
MENKLTEIEQAKAILKQHGYFVDHLWSIDDIKNFYECTDDDAYLVIRIALRREQVLEQTWFAIQHACSYLDIDIKY